VDIVDKLVIGEPIKHTRVDRLCMYVCVCVCVRAETFVMVPAHTVHKALCIRAVRPDLTVYNLGHYKMILIASFYVHDVLDLLSDLLFTDSSINLKSKEQ